LESSAFQPEPVDLLARIDSFGIQGAAGAVAPAASANLVLLEQLRYDRFCFSKML
jgi:hypothetical protein